MLLGLIAMLFTSIIAFGQQTVITGKVVDSSGAPLAGASVTEKGTKKGVSADGTGVFKITVAPNATLIISAAGFLTKEVAASNANNIVLTGDTRNLNEVVVTAMGLRRSEKSLGYSVSKVDPNSVLQKSEPDLLKGLQGKVAGVDIRSGQGTPGAATRIQIRGNSSFFGDNQPLIIVDGVPYSNDVVSSNVSTVSGGGAYGSGLSNLDPNDIATMNVLKGSSAGALYGSRASNGVIVITTKTGSAGRGRKGSDISFKSSFSMEKIANLPDYQNKYGTGSQGVAGGGSNGSWGKRFEANDSVPVWAAYGAAYPELFPTGNVAYKAYPNNVKDLFKTGYVTENSVGFNTGDAITSFAITASNMTHSGYVDNNTYKRNNFSAGGSSKTSIGLNVRANFSYSNSEQKGGLFGDNQNSNESVSSQFARSMFLGRSWDVNLPYETKTGDALSWVGSQADHPFWAAKYNKQTTDEDRMVGTAHLDYEFTKWLRADYNIGVNVSTLKRNEIQEVSSRGGLGKLAIDNYRKAELENTFVLSASPEITEDFTLKASAGINYNQRTIKRDFGRGGYLTDGATGGYITRGVYTLENFKNTDRVIFNTYSRRRLMGLFGELNLGFKNYLFLNATGRNDISSTLPENNRSYFYPSVSGSFVFSDAFNIKGGILDYGKIRAGWAKVGRDADPYNINNIYVLGTPFLGQATGTISPSSNGGSALKPEFTKELEVGASFGFFKRKFEFDITLYDKKSSNMIAPVTTPSSSGYTSFYTNFGGIQNKGIEIEATVRPVTTKNFSWEISAVFTKNESTVTSLAPGLTHLDLGGGYATATTSFEVGKPYGFLYGTKVLRDSASGALLIDPATGTMIQDPTPGMVGNPNPDFKMGITNRLTFKGFFVSALFDMTKGGDIYSITTQSYLGRGVTMDTEDRETGWVIPGIYGDPTTGKPIVAGGKTIQNQTRITTNDLYFSPNGGNTFAVNTATEWSVYDATVYRLRELTLGYSFPTKMFTKTPIKGLSLTLTGRNLWFLAPNFPKYSNYDPEMSSYTSNIQGLEFSAAPTTKRFGINLAATF